MSTVALAAFGTSPGLTTSAIALALQWPRPVLLVEADVLKPTSVVTGFMQGSIGADSGLMGIVQSSLRKVVTPQDIWDFAIPLSATPAQATADTSRWLLAGLPNPAAAKAMRSFWPELLDALARMGADGYDALFDLGRAEQLHGRGELLTGTDHLLVAVRSDLTSIAALKAHLPELQAARQDGGASGEMSLIVMDDLAHRVPGREISKFLGLDIVGRIPHAPQAAAKYSSGATVSKRQTRTYDSSHRAIAATVASALAKRRDLLDIGQAAVIAGEMNHA